MLLSPSSLNVAPEISTNTIKQSKDKIIVKKQGMRWLCADVNMENYEKSN